MGAVELHYTWQHVKGPLIAFIFFSLVRLLFLPLLVVMGRCLRCLQQVKDEYYLVKNKLQTLFREIDLLSKLEHENIVRYLG